MTRYLVFFCSILFFETQAQVISYHGLVRDGRTREALPYATIVIKGTGISTLAGSEGTFSIKVPASALRDTLEISFVGYQTELIPVQNLPEGQTIIALRQAVKVLQEVTVIAPSGLSIIKEALARIPINYDTIRRGLQAFYRESINLGKDSITFDEAVIGVSKSSYANDLDKDQAKVLKARKKKIRWRPDPIYGWVSGFSNGVRGSLLEDIVRSRNARFSPINPKNFRNYNFVLSDQIDQGNKTLYVINVSPSKRAPRSTLVVEGKIYVNARSFAFERCDWKLAPAGVRYLNHRRGAGYRIMTVAYQCSFEFTGVHEIISYAEFNGKWYYQSVQREFTAAFSSAKRKMKNVPWSVKTVLATTEIKPGKADPITDGDIMDNSRAFAWLINGHFDEGFWENYNVVKPAGVDSLGQPLAPKVKRPLPRVSNRQNGFTRADTLRGKLSPLRTCYDVTFYHLNVEVFPETKSITGDTYIRFRVIQPFTRLQIDLFANMHIEKILYRGQALSYSREFDAVYVEFPEKTTTGREEEIRVFYSGIPQVPNFRISMNGGFLWDSDSNGKPWIMVACQGSGASLWWPNKDHLSDKPDSARITVTVPSGLADISNGRLRSKTDLPGNRTRFDWYVSYPIENYNLTMNIGVYDHIRDYYKRATDTLTLDYYFLPAEAAKAHELFAGVKPMLTTYESIFGPFPFPRDGFTVMESLYPMEHQSAVSVGKFNGEKISENGRVADSLSLQTLFWHECAHEWWGNSVSVRDMADFWIHEGLATYAEAIMDERTIDYTASAEKMNAQHVLNKEPIIGVYDVNHIFYDIGDCYNKAALMLNTLRHVVNDDEKWWKLFRAIQEKFRYQNVNSDELISFINKELGADYTYLFDQYLRHAAIPKLELVLDPAGSSIKVRYRWVADVAGFHMPVKITRSPGHFDFIYPTDKWQTITLPVAREDFEVDELDFYIETSIE